MTFPLHSIQFPRKRRFERPREAMSAQALVNRRSAGITGGGLRVRGARTQGFSLVEVVLAIGIVAFAAAPMFAFLPLGLTTFRQSAETSVGSQIVEQIINDAQQTDFNTLLTSGTSMYFDDQGNKLSSAVGSVYTAQVTVSPQTDLPNSLAIASSNLATVSVRLATNPGQAPLTGPNAVPSTVYSALIARNL